MDLFGGGGSAPAAPDPYKTADAQWQANQKAALLQTQLNRPDQVTPYGTLKWSNNKTFDQSRYDADMAKYNTASQPGVQPIYSGNGSSEPTDGGSPGGGQLLTPGTDGVYSPAGTAPNKDDYYTGGDNWTSTIQLDPRVQSIIDAQMFASQGMFGSLNKSTARAQDMLSQGINYDGAPAAGTVQGAYDAASGRFMNLDPAQATAGGLQTQAGQTSAQAMGNFQQMLGQPGPEASDATRKRVEDALYQRATSRLDPQFAQQENAMRTELINRGIPEGSEAFKTQMDNFARSKTDAYGAATNDSIKAGGDAMQQLYDMELRGRQQTGSEAQIGAGLASGATGDLTKLGALGVAQSGALDNAAQTQFGMQNAERSYNLNEQTAKRQQVLDELARVRGMITTEQPQFSNGASGAGVAPANISDAIYKQYQGDLANYNADVAGSNSTMGSLFGLAGSAMSGGTSSILAKLLGL